MTIKEAFEKLVDTTAAAMKNPFFVMRKLHSAFVDIADNIEGGGGGSTVEVEAIQTTGTKIATISVDDVDTDLYAPSQLHEYSTTEKVVGKWIDGKDIYEKVVTIASLPSTPFTWAAYAHNISNLDTIIDFDILYHWSDGITKKFDTVGTSGENLYAPATISTRIDNTNIGIWVGIDRSALNGIVIIRYTKASS